MSIYSTVTAHNQPSNNESEVNLPSVDESLVKLDALTEKGTTLAGTALPNEDDYMAEYFSDDEEREKIRAQRAKEKKNLDQLHKNERDT